MAVRVGSVTASQGILLGAFVVRMGLALGITTLLGRSLSPAHFGFYALVATFFFLAHVLLDLGTGSVAVREIAKEPVRERPVLEGLVGWRRLVGLVLGAAVCGYACTEPDLGRRAVLFGVGGLFMLMAPGALSVVFHIRQAQRGPALVGIFTQALVLGGVALFGVLGMPGASFAWLILMREGLNVALVSRLAVRALGYTPRPGLRDRGLRPFLAMALVQGLAVLAQTAYFHVDVLIVRALRGEAELGAYAAAFRPVNILLMLPSLLLTPVLPVLARRVGEGPDAFARDVRGATVLFGGIGAAAAALGAVLAPDLLTVLYGDTYAAGDLSAVDALRWMCAALFVVFLGAPVVVGLLAAGRERDLLRVSLWGLAVNVVANAILVPRFGFTAAALTTLLTEGVVVASCVFRFRQATGALPLDVGELLIPLPAIAVAALVNTVDAGALTRVLLGGLGGAVLLVALLAHPRARRWRAQLHPDPEASPGEEPRV